MCICSALSRPTGQGPSRHEVCLCSKGVGLPLPPPPLSLSLFGMRFTVYLLPLWVSCETAPVAATRAAEPPRDLKNGRVNVSVFAWCRDECVCVSGDRTRLLVCVCLSLSLCLCVCCRCILVCMFSCVRLRVCTSSNT